MKTERALITQMLPYLADADTRESRSIITAAREYLAAPEQSEPRKMEIPPAPIGMDEVCFAEGWNACCDAFFSGLPPQEPLVITVTHPAPKAPEQSEPVDSIKQEAETGLVIGDAIGMRDALTHT